MINDILYAFYYTWPMWAVLGILCIALFVEEGIIAHNRKKMVDNPAIW
jgi:hypothetical protein